MFKDNPNQPGSGGIAAGVAAGQQPYVHRVNDRLDSFRDRLSTMSQRLADVGFRRVVGPVNSGATPPNENSAQEITTLLLNGIGDWITDLETQVSQIG